MSGRYNSVSKIVQDQHSLAVYVHCATHSLNLDISRACKVQEVQNYLCTIEKCHTFFNTPKRWEVLNDPTEENRTWPKNQNFIKTVCYTLNCKF